MNIFFSSIFFNISNVVYLMHRIVMMLKKPILTKAINTFAFVLFVFSELNMSIQAMMIIQNMNLGAKNKLTLMKC